MSSPDRSGTATTPDLETLLDRLEVALGASAGTWPSDEDVQRLFTAALLLFSRRAQAGDMYEPLCPDHAVSATDAVIAASALLAQLNLEVFELGLWQSLGGQPWKKETNEGV